MQPVECMRCGNSVLVEKNSFHHTAIQWTTPDAEASCAEFREDAPSRARTVRVRVCGALRDSIDTAVIEGRLDVPDN